MRTEPCGACGALRLPPGGLTTRLWHFMQRFDSGDGSLIAKRSWDELGEPCGSWQTAQVIGISLLGSFASTYREEAFQAFSTPLPSWQFTQDALVLLTAWSTTVPWPDCDHSSTNGWCAPEWQLAQLLVESATDR